MSDSLPRARAADSLPRARAAIRRIDQYRPPLGERVGLRLDFNENTRESVPGARQALRELEPDCLARYPEREPLERRVAQFFGLGSDEVLLTNGADEAISLVCQTFLEAGDRALVVVPTFAMYERQAAACGATVVRVPADEDFGLPTARLLSRIDSGTRLIAIADPNNPTGALAGRDDLLAVVRAAPQAAVLVDEAYGEFSGRTIVPEIRALPNLFVVRTFSKAYGMAGLRIGALLGRADRLAMVRRVASPYSVNAVALACLPAALDDQAYLRSCVADVCREREHLRGRCRREASAAFRAMRTSCWPGSGRTPDRSWRPWRAVASWYETVRPSRAATAACVSPSGWPSRWAVLWRLSTTASPRSGRRKERSHESGAGRRYASETSISLKLAIDGRGCYQVVTGIASSTTCWSCSPVTAGSTSSCGPPAIWTSISTTPSKMSASPWAKPSNGPWATNTASSRAG